MTCNSSDFNDIEDLMKGKKHEDVATARDRKWEQAGVKTRINKKKKGCCDNSPTNSCSKGDQCCSKGDDCCSTTKSVTSVKEEKKVQRPVDDDDDDAGFSRVIPGTQKIFVKTFGCSHNVSDSEYMMGQLVDYGYGIVPNPNDADLILVNSCTVKNPSQEAFVT